MTAGPICIAHHSKAVLATTGYLCAHHFDLISGWLADVEDWYLHHRVFRPTALTIAVTDQRASWKEGKSGELQQNEPARTLAFLRHLNPLSGQLESNGADVPDVPALVDLWVKVWSEEFNPDPEVTQVVPESFAARLTLLRRQVLWIVEQPWLDEFMEDVRACQKSLAKVVGEATGPRPVGPCLNCGTNMYSSNELELWASRREHRDPTFHRPDDEDAPDVIECKSCGERLEGTAIIRWRLAQESPGWDSGEWTCDRCNDTWRMWFNGGELDRHVCSCGRTWITVIRDVDLMVAEPTEVTKP